MSYLNISSTLWSRLTEDSVSPPSTNNLKWPSVLNIDGESVGSKLHIDPEISKAKTGNIFEWTFNKELILDEDEVPIVLYELHENSLLYMDREEWDKALILLNKA